LPWAIAPEKRRPLADKPTAKTALDGVGAPFNYSKKAKTDGWPVVPNAHQGSEHAVLLKHGTEFKVTQMEKVTSTGRCNTLPCWTEVECYATTNEAPVLHRRRERGDLVSMA
jgi:hypothetical protein